MAVMPTTTSGALSANSVMAGAYAVQALGSLLAGQAQAAAYEAKARLAQVNANIARQQGAAAADSQRRIAARQMGSMVANYGASGVQTDSGSPVDVLADSAAMATLDNLTIKYNAELKALGYQVESSMDLASAENARTSAVLNAAASGLSAYATYYGYNKVPGTDTGNPLVKLNNNAGTPTNVSPSGNPYA